MEKLGENVKFTSKLDDLDFSDEVALLSSTEKQIQDKTSRMKDEARPSGSQNQHRGSNHKERITITGKDIKDVDEFTYLRATVCKEGGGMKDLKNRLSKARGTFIRLKGKGNEEGRRQTYGKKGKERSRMEDMGRGKSCRSVQGKVKKLCGGQRALRRKVTGNWHVALQCTCANTYMNNP